MGHYSLGSVIPGLAEPGLVFAPEEWELRKGRRVLSARVFPEEEDAKISSLFAGLRGVPCSMAGTMPDSGTRGRMGARFGLKGKMCARSGLFLRALP